MFFDEGLETLERSHLEGLQDQLLRALVGRVFEAVPFYKRSLKESGIHPASFRGLEDLEQLPFTFKTDFREQYPWGLLAIPRSEVARFHASSGTTGKPIITGYSKQDLQVFAEVNARSLVAAGAEPGMLLHNAYGYGLFTGGLGIHGGAEALGLVVLPVSGGMTVEQIRLIQDLQPDIICCTPSYAQTLAERFTEAGISPSEISLKLALLGAEPWTETIRHAVDEGLGLVSTNIYGLTEIIGPGVSQECVEETSGSHIWEDHFLPEIIDPVSKRTLPAGEPGVLVLTTLSRQAQPVLRYWTGDICSLDPAPCSCRRTHLKMSRIQGRTDDLIILRGVNLYPTQLEEILQWEEQLAPHYQIILTRPQTLDELNLRVEVQPHSPLAGQLAQLVDQTTDLPAEVSAQTSQLIQMIRDTLGVRVKVHLCAPGELPRSEGGKLQRLVDQRDP